MIKAKFSKWVRWSERASLSGIKYPGVYALAVSAKDISNLAFHWPKEIKYFGMTNSVGGLQKRLHQFNYTIAHKKKGIHGGAERFLRKYNDYIELTKKLYVSVCTIECDVKSNEPRDLLKMGEVAWIEYYCFSEYKKRHKTIPKFNDKKNSKKYEWATTNEHS